MVDGIDIFLDNNDIVFSNIGDIQMASGEDYVHNIIYHAIMTHRDELVMHPGYGSIFTKMRLKSGAHAIDPIREHMTEILNGLPIVDSVVSVDIIHIEEEKYNITYTVIVSGEEITGTLYVNT